MDIIEVSCIEDIGNEILNDAANKRISYAVLFFDKAKELMRYLLTFEEVDIGLIDLSSDELDYCDEYYVCVDSDFVLYVEPAKNNDRYLGTGADVMYLDGEANSRISLVNSDTKFQYEIVFLDEDEDEYDDEDDEEDDDEDSPLAFCLPCEGTFDAPSGTVVFNWFIDGKQVNIKVK